MKKSFKTGDYIVATSGTYGSSYGIKKDKIFQLNTVYRQCLESTNIVILYDDKLSNWKGQKSSGNTWRYATDYEISLYELVDRPVNLQNLIYPGDLVECINDIPVLKYSKQGIEIKKGDQFKVEDTLIVKRKFYIYFKGIPGVYLWRDFKRDVQGMTKVYESYGGTETCLKKETI